MARYGSYFSKLSVKIKASEIRASRAYKGRKDIKVFSFR